MATEAYLRSVMSIVNSGATSSLALLAKQAGRPERPRLVFRLGKEGRAGEHSTETFFGVYVDQRLFAKDE